jgi:integrase
MNVKVYAVTKPRAMWQVSYWHEGKRVRKHYGTQEEADKAAREIAKTINLVGTVGLHLDAAMRSDYLSARKILDAAGWTEIDLTEIARDFVATATKASTTSTPVGPLVEEFVRVKEHDENRSARWVRTLGIRVRAWIEAQAIATLADVTRDNVMPLRAREGVSARTRLADMTAVSTFCAWLVAEKWIQANPLDGVPRPEADATDPRVLTAEQVRALLDAARRLGDGRLLRYFALAIFAGLRPGEIARLRPEHLRVNATQPVIRVVGGKRRQRVRAVPVLPTLKAWLKAAPEHWPISALDGKDRKLFDEVRQEAGLVTWDGQLRGRRTTVQSAWQDDICRHTFISLRMAMTHDEGAVALEAGNTPDVIHAHYLSMIDAKEMRAILAVRP